MSLRCMFSELQRSVRTTRVILCLFVCVCVSGAARATDNFTLAQENVDTLRISAFVTAGDIRRHLGDEQSLAEAARILKALGVTKVFLDIYRDGYVTELDLLTRARDYFRSQGMDTAAGLTTTRGIGVKSPTHKYFLCYNYAETRDALRKIVEDAAPLFDELIVDDFFATDCECEECGALKGDRDWPEFFRDLMLDVTRTDVVGPAKKANPSINTVIKYPQWYDRYHRFGYDPARQRDVFDQIWVGAETRDPDKENVQQYEAFVNYTWMASVSGEKMRGAWFDTINTSPDVYMEQAWQSVLGGAQEITLFGYTPTNFTGPDLQRFSQEVPGLFRLANLLKGMEHDGIFAYKPPNGDPGADHYIFDFMGMLGLPLVMAADFPDADSQRAVFLSEHALADPDIAAKVLKCLENRNVILMTSGFLAGMKDYPEVMAAAGFSKGRIKRVQKRMATEFESAGGTRVRGKGMYMLGAVMEPDDPGSVIVSAEVNEKLIPVVTSHEVRNGDAWHRVVVFNTRTYDLDPDSRSLTVSGPVFIQNLPVEVAQVLRELAFEVPGIQLIAPINVAFYKFTKHGGFLYAVENFNDSAVEAKLCIYPGRAPDTPAPFTMADVLTGDVFPEQSMPCVDVPMPAHSLRVLAVAR